MHLVLPFAGAGTEPAVQALKATPLPHLERLLALLPAAARDEGDALSLSLPHERVQARAQGWPVADGLLPFAAQAARADGVATDGRGCAFLHPVHWHLGTEQVSLTDPSGLQLDEADARVFFDALRPLFEDVGFALHWGAPTRWYALHPSLATLPSASLDRVVGRNVDFWLNKHPDARPVRRLQAEAQMLLHTHPTNERRQAEGRLPVNSFWLSGTGVPAKPATALPDGVQIDHRLRAPALAEDWAAWGQAWAALDAGPLAELLRAVDAGQAVTLTLCGERTAQRFDAQPRPLWRRLLGPGRRAATPVLQAL